MSSLLLVPLDDLVVFPNMNVTIAVDVGNEEQVLLVPRHEGEYAKVGTVAEVGERVRMPGGGRAVNLVGLHRAELGAAHTDPQGNLRVEITERPDEEPAGIHTRELETEYRATVEEILELRGDDGRISSFVRAIRETGALADTVAYAPDLRFDQKIELLETIDVVERLKLALSLQRERLAELQVRRRIREDVEEGAAKQQREYVLRKQMESIRKELGEDDASVSEDYRTKIAEAGMPDAVREQAEREAARLERIGDSTGESSMIRTYLDWLVSIPWSKRSEERLDPIFAREVLDEDHAGLEDVKERIVEYLAVRKLREERGIAEDKRSGAILTLIGPPGTGKTSIGESIARALNREFVRMSLGGVRDEAEIRGHRRTYIGALPGRLVRALRDAGTMNPVILLDEVDKVGSDWRGDPSAALLEVLDPAQNHSFRDHYLDVELDLSEVIFIATANVAETIPGPLLDRMEVIRFDGYTTDEKVAIARGYLWPRQRDRSGLLEEEVTISDERARDDRLAVHARGRRPAARARARQAAAEDRDEAHDRGCHPADRDRRAAASRRTREAALLPGGGRADRRGRRRDGARGHRDRRRRPLRRGDADGGQGGPRAHGPAWRRDEGVGADRALLHPLARRRARDRRGRLRGLELPRSRARGRDPEGWPERRRHDVDGARLAPDRTAGEAHRRDDRRGHAPGTRAADRRAQAEGARRPCRRAHRRDHPRAEPRGHRGHPRGRPGRAQVPPGDDASARCSTWRWSPRRARSMRCRNCTPLPEEVRRAAGLLERRWTMSILVASHEGAVRFNEFLQMLGSVPPATLTSRLSELEEAGILVRVVVDARPPRVEYRLTPRGEQLGTVVVAIQSFALTAE